MRRTRYLRNLGYIHEPIEIAEPRVQMAIICLNYNFGVHWLRDHFILCDSASNSTIYACPNFDPMVEWEVTIITEARRLRGFRYTHFVLLQYDEMMELQKWEMIEGVHRLMYGKEPNVDPIAHNHHLQFTDPEHYREVRDKRAMEYSLAMNSYKEFLEW